MKQLKQIVKMFTIICWLITVVLLTFLYFSAHNISYYIYIETSRIENENEYMSTVSSDTADNATDAGKTSSPEYECQTSTSTEGEYLHRTEQDEQAKRSALLEKVCVEDKVNSMKLEKRHFLLDHKHRIFYCWIHKAASTSWVTFMARLQGIQVPPTKVYRKIGHLAAKSTEEALSAANDYPFRFIVVRHPFRRLISAYRDRIWAATKKFSAQAWTHAPRILRLTRPSLSHSPAVSFLNNENKTLNTVPTFEEFVEYLITIAGIHRQREENPKEQTKVTQVPTMNVPDISSFDVHWIPYYYHCSICNISYNIIIKLETIEKDAKYFIKELNAAIKRDNEIFERSRFKNILKNKTKNANITEVKHVNSTEVIKENREIEEILDNPSDCSNTQGEECEEARQSPMISDFYLRRLQQSDIGPSCHCFYFSQLSKAQFDDLTNIYDIDLKMFNYDTHEYEKCLAKD